MTSAKRVAFYAPIKPPDHPIPSGDRLIARNLVKALGLANCDVQLASSFIAYSKRSDPAILASRKMDALSAADRLVAQYEATPNALLPEIWITYHPYCKAPDWIGPRVSKVLGIPYVTIEAARTGQGDETDPWKPWRKEAQEGILAADLHLVFKPSDRAYLTGLLGSDKKLIDFPTFVDLEDLTGKQTHALPTHWAADTPVLITTGMMRKGKKDRNFYMLAEVLSRITESDWNLIIVGGGPEEAAIRNAYGAIPEQRIHWTGQVEHTDVLEWMRAADIFIWPGWKEPIGMVYLEAQVQGLPVIAYDSMGVPLVVTHGETGLLAPEGDDDGLRDNLIQLLNDKSLRTRLGKAAQASVLSRHSLEAAAKRLQQLVSKLV
ncbi:MAG: glycosyltransferase family 4 protein [Pseudomonadota bacterium]